MAKGGIQIKLKRRGLDIDKYLAKLQKPDRIQTILEEYAEIGVKLLSEATPVDTGLTASSWYSEIERQDDVTIIRWLNSNVQRGVNIALILDAGHGTGSGGWVEGRNYIDPAMQPLFDELADKCWSEVTRV